MELAWKKIEDFEDYYVSGHSMALYKDKIFLLFGELGQVDALESRDPTDSIYIVDLIDGEENELDPGIKPNGRRNTTICHHDKFIVLFAGDDCDAVFRNDTWIFDLEKLKWKYLRCPENSLPPERRYPAITVHDGRYLYVHSGEYETIALDDFWCCDLWNAKWTEIEIQGVRPRPGRYASLVTIDDCLWRFGGRDDAPERFNNLYLYDIKNDLWDEPKTRGITPSGRSAHSACVFDVSFFIFGGNSGASNNDLFEFNTVTLTWTQLIPSGIGPTKRYWHGAAINPVTGEMYISGGYNEEELTLDDMWKISLNRPNSKNDIQINVYRRDFAYFQDVIIN